MLKTSKPVTKDRHDQPWQVTESMALEAGK
jgi:hypothetical protein